MKSRLTDRLGSVEESVASLEDASNAIGYFKSGFPFASSRAFFLRRWGSTSSTAADGGGAACVAGVLGLAVPVAESAMELCSSLPDPPNELVKDSFSVEFVQK